LGEWVLVEWFMSCDR